MQAVMRNLHGIWSSFSNDTNKTNMSNHTNCQGTSQNLAAVQTAVQISCVYGFTAVCQATDPMPTFAQTVSKY